MSSYLLALCLAAVPAESTTARFAEIRDSVQTGTLIFSQGDCLAVKVFSGSSFTHVATVVREPAGPVVYDAMNGPGVRKTPMDDYLRFLVPSDVEIIHPARPWTESQTRAYVDHLNSQLGRRYRIRHHVTGGRTDGVHCAEYLTDALIAAGQMTASQPSRVSPGSLRQGALEGGVYVAGATYDFAEAKPAEPINETWCQWSCRETAECCSATCRQLSRWFLCREK
ncbi:MAG: YiiX/YebB-like N1pC/P60 family cysteine hydrolase [Planctomycetaceae bacterium]|nr:YiiX/YebB-like N1pC/P60 family cysteine hydrolase [Planctomycetaceae bacterium]